MSFYNNQTNETSLRLRETKLVCNPVGVLSVLRNGEAALIMEQTITQNGALYLVQRKQTTAKTVSYHDSSRRISDSKIERVHKLAPQSWGEAESLYRDNGR